MLTPRWATAVVLAAGAALAAMSAPAAPADPLVPTLEPTLPLVLAQPEAPMSTIETEVVVNGRTADGALVEIFRDVDGDGHPDGEAIEQQQLSPEARAFEFHVAIDAPRFIVRATRGAETSPPVSTPDIEHISVPSAPVTYAEGRLHVRVADGVDADAAARRIERRLADRSVADGSADHLFTQRGDEVLGQWLLVDVRPGQEARAESVLRGDSDVAVVERATVLRSFVVPNDPRRGDQYALDRIQAYAAWDLGRSQTTTQIAVLDGQFEGVHPDLATKFDNIEAIEAGCATTVGKYWHGTAVASDAAAATDNGQGIAGVGFNAHLLGYQLGIVSDFGDGPECAISDRYVDAITRATDAGADIINMSFGGPRDLGVAARDAIRYASNRGVLLVASAGNEATQAASFPAAQPEVMSIGATTSADVRWSDSNFGPTLSMVAPGADILSAMPQADPLGPYAYTSGTSFAAPITAGAGALVQDRWGVRGLRVRHRLEDAADDLFAYPGDVNNDVGNGRLNARRAMSEQVIRLAGLDRQRTAGEVAREAAPVAPPGRTDILDTIVLISSDKPNGWIDTLASGPLLNRHASVFVATRADRLDAVAANEINRLFGGEGANPAKHILIPGGPGGSISAAVESELAQRFDVRRIAGANRYATAAAIATDVIRPGITEAVVTRGDVFADALAMAAVTARRGLPMLFVDDSATTVPAETCTWLVQHPTVTTIHLAGGVAAISPAVASQLMTGCGVIRTVTREAGVDRFDTAVQIAQAHFPNPDGFVVAYGYDWGDAMAGASLARVFNAPVLLTDQGSLNAAAAGYIRSTKARRPSIDVGWVLGGPTLTVSRAAEATFEDLLG